MDANILAAATAALGTLVTAVATVALWRVTATLARETTRLADATDQPQVVATLRTNRWSIIHADLTVQNCGNAAAFDVKVEFDPPLEIEHKELGVPFQKVSLLRPGELLSSHVGASYPLTEKHYTITTSWLRTPSSSTRENLRYHHSMADLKGMGQLGGGDPLVQLADQVKKLREDWQYVASGSRRVEADVFTAADRTEEGRVIDNAYGRQADERAREEELIRSGHAPRT